MNHRPPALPVRRLALAALFAAIALGVALASPGAHAVEADGSGTVFGFVAVDDRGALPTKIRALGPGVPGRPRAICGTTDVIRSGEGTGFYLITVVPSAAREGCPAPGEQVRFLLLYGAVDPGIEARQAALFAPGSTQRVDLSPYLEHVEIAGFAGSLPAGPGFALLYWHGPDHTPVEHAIRAIPREVQVVFLIGTQSVRRYIVNAPAFVSDLRELNQGDVVVVLVK